MDVVDVHYYAQDCSTDDGILQAARSLYDPDYKENSWLSQWFGSSFPFLTRMQESIDKYYPGTKLALTEYNLPNISGRGQHRQGRWFLRCGDRGRWCICEPAYICEPIGERFPSVRM